MKDNNDQRRGAGSRREFLQRVISVPVAARFALGAGLELLMPPARRAVASGSGAESGTGIGAGVQFSQPGFIRYDGRCFTVNDRDTYLFGAAFHYPRCPRELWRDRLTKLRAAGFNVIETYVFWNYHEPEEGHADLSEFEEFIKLVASMGFYMIARPGPYVCAEWDSGGFPRWVVNKRFPLRSDHSESIRTSQHWFDLVLPVIVRHQVTHSGPIILMQVENEYNYWKLPDTQKRAYVRALARKAWDAGIDIPLITCWTQQVRDRQDPDFSRMLDTCNFYPRWHVTEELIPALAKLRHEQPDTPLGVTEMQGGWFSEFGGKLSVDQDGVNGRQLNLISKTAIEQGVVYFNYYMGFGGTNFDWAAKTLTTTYDYAAPLREPGGVGEKYYAARGVGASLRLMGKILTRADAAAGAAQSTNPHVTVSLRSNNNNNDKSGDKSGVLFIRENSDSKQSFIASFQDPNSPTHRIISAPREGALDLGPREMKMLPVEMPIGDYTLRYSTAEVLAYGESGRPFLVLYDEPERLVELGLGAEKEPTIEGDTEYRYWDPDYETWVCGLRVEQGPKMLLFNGHLQLVLLPRDLALKSWVVQWPASILPGNAALPADEQKGLVSVPFFTDAALATDSGRSKKTVWADFDLAPGEHQVTVLVPPVPQKLWLNGIETEFDYDRHWETCRFKISTPKLPVESRLTLKPVETWVERFDPGLGDWVETPLRPLDDLGALPYGYVKYRADFTLNGELRMFISAFADDGKKVFINGKLVPEASKPLANVDFPLADYARAGANRLEISYELFGCPNFGEKIAEMKGIEGVRYGADRSSASAIDQWQLQRFAAPMHGRQVDLNFTGLKSGAVGKAASGALGSGGLGSVAPAGGAQGRAGSGAGPPIHAGIVPTFTWCRAEFALDAVPEEWSIPWRLAFEADRDALIYLNGRFVGRYVIAGPQEEFFLPDPYLTFGAKSRNILTAVLAYTDSAAPIRTLAVEPYEEFSLHRTRVEFKW